MDPEGAARGQQGDPGGGRGAPTVFLLEEEELEELGSDQEELGSDLEELNTVDHNQLDYSDVEDTQDLLDEIKQHCGENGRELVFTRAECPGFFPAYPACAAQEIWETSPGSLSEYWVCHDKQHNGDECVRSSTRPSAPITDRFCASVALPGPATSTISSLVSYTRGPIGSPRDAFGRPAQTLVSSEWSPVSMAAHLHLLGEALSLIGLHLKGTNKLVSVSNSLSLLLDSVLCALAPLTFLTAEIPELESCTQHTLASTLENIAYLMPGM